ncbi:MAG TPA: hypothetical protein VK613_09130, partial [Gaiellaceae bacterium]|nr:hypothetical protein [Gaiellaceae bacterium]
MNRNATNQEEFMDWRRFRAWAVALLFATLVVGSLVATPAASAATTATTITTPTDLPFFDALLDPNTLTTADTFSIVGTATPDVTEVDILCSHGSSFTTVANAVPVTAGAFATQANLQSIWGASRLCHLRAIPTGTDPTTADLTPFSGPRVAVDGHAQSTVSGGPNAGSPYDYYLYAQQVTGALDYVSLGDCGLDDGYLFDPSLALTTTTYFCNAGLLRGESASPTRSELRIDGANAYAPDVAESINSSATGLPAVNYSYSVDSAT